jgi:hypothetical protein
MGCLIRIPERVWMSCLWTRQEERSPVGTQRIISIPRMGLLPLPQKTELPRLPSFMTLDRIAPCLFNWLALATKIKVLITVIPKGVENIDASKLAEYSCIGEVLAPQSEQRARVGTQRCIPNPLSLQDRLVRCSLGSLTRAPKHLNPQTLARASPP